MHEAHSYFPGKWIFKREKNSKKESFLVSNNGELYETEKRVSMFLFKTF